MVLRAPRLGLPEHIMAVVGQIGSSKKLNTARFYPKIGGDVIGQD
jgi:hypothetical protein